MARGINKVILVGHLGKDPETTYTQSGMAITRISLATTTSRKDRDGNTQEKTEWHRVVFFNRLAEIAGEYLRKGASVYIEGRLSYGSYEKDGVKHYTTDIVADEMQMLGGRSDVGGQYESQQRGQPAQRQQGRSAPSQSYGNRGQGNGGQRSQQYNHPEHGGYAGGGFDEDDIPF